MSFGVKLFLVYLAIISLISYFLCIYDKRAAIKQKSRIPEKTLFLFSFLGGSIAMLITMKIIRHKTLHKRFMIGFPLIILLQIGLAFILIYLTR